MWRAPALSRLHAEWDDIRVPLVAAAKQVAFASGPAFGDMNVGCRADSIASLTLVDDHVMFWSWYFGTQIMFPPIASSCRLSANIQTRVQFVA